MESLQERMKKKFKFKMGGELLQEVNGEQTVRLSRDKDFISEIYNIIYDEPQRKNANAKLNDHPRKTIRP